MAPSPEHLLTRATTAIFPSVKVELGESPGVGRGGLIFLLRDGRWLIDFPTVWGDFESLVNRLTLGIVIAILVSGDGREPYPQAVRKNFLAA